MAVKFRRTNPGSCVNVVDVPYNGHLPPIYSVLQTGDKQQIVIEVPAQRDAGHVRGIALTPTQGLARGMAAVDSGRPLNSPAGNAIDREPALSDVQWRLAQLREAKGMSSP